MNEKTLTRFLSKFAKTDGDCWTWTATADHKGYGRLGVSGRTLMAHRLSYEHFVAPIPPGMQLDHLCRNRRCVNPAHLEPVTGKENVRRGNTGANLPNNDGRSRCLRDHPLSGDNLYIKPNGRRVCRQCERIRRRAWQARQ